MKRITPGTTNLASIRLKHVTADRDRHGNIRYYVRLSGERKRRLRGLPGSEEFMAGYQAAISKVQDEPRLHRIVSPGSFRATVAAYYASPEFIGLDASTKAWRRRALDEVCRAHGGNPVFRMEPNHVRKLRDARWAGPPLRTPC